MGARSEDPWNPSDESVIKGTLDRRRKQFESLVATVQAMVGHLQAKISRVLPKLPETNLANYDVLDRSKADYKAEKAREVIEIIRGHYRGSQISPLSKAVRYDRLDDFSAEGVQDLYGRATEPLIEAVGKGRFGQRMNTIQDKVRDSIVEALLGRATAGFSTAVHGDAVMDVLLTKYGVERQRVDLGVLRTQVPRLIEQEVQRALTPESFYDLAPRYDFSVKRPSELGGGGNGGGIEIATR